MASKFITELEVAGKTYKPDEGKSYLLDETKNYRIVIPETTENVFYVEEVGAL